MAKNGKKHLKHCNYDSAMKFKLAGVGMNTIILFFSDKNYKNIIYVPDIEGSAVIQHLQKWDESIFVSLQPMVNLDGGDVPPMVNHCTALSSMKISEIFRASHVKLKRFLHWPSNVCKESSCG